MEQNDDCTIYIEQTSDTRQRILFSVRESCRLSFDENRTYTTGVLGKGRFTLIFWKAPCD
jgi:hypothetical protein